MHVFGKLQQGGMSYPCIEARKKVMCCNPGSVSAVLC